MTSPVRTPGAARSIGARIRAARSAAKLNQHELAQKMGIAERQTISTIESGDRRVQAEELLRFSEVLQRPIEWFIDPFVVAGEAVFSWRVARVISDELLDGLEARIGQIVGLYRHLKTALRGPSKALSRSMHLPPHATFEDAWGWGESVAQELDLGLLPSERLIEHIEQRLDISVLFIDAEVGTGSNGISGAMCRLPEQGVMIINRRESPERRNFDVAHELFHALTWDAHPPSRREDPDTKKRDRVEQLADNFAAALLMPKSSLRELIDPAHFADVEHLGDVAPKLQVSTGAFAFRLHNAGLIDRATFDGVYKLDNRIPRDQVETPRLLSDTFVSLLHDGIARGHVSSRKAAKALTMTLDDLALLLRSYNKPVPFSI